MTMDVFESRYYTPKLYAKKETQIQRYLRASWELEFYFSVGFRFRARTSEARVYMEDKNDVEVLFGIL